MKTDRGPAEAVRRPALIIIALLLLTCLCTAQKQAEEDYAFAEGLYAQGQYRLAAKKFAAFVEKYPDHANLALALFRAGECNFRIDKFTTAAEYFSQVTERLPKASQAEAAWLWLGDSYYKAGDYKNATDAYEGLLEQFPESDNAARARYWRGESYYQLKQYEIAITAYNAAIENGMDETNTAYAVYSIGLCNLNLDRYDDAIQQFQKVVDEHPDSPVAVECRFLMGSAYQSRNEFDTAIDVFEKVIQRGPTTRFGARAQLQIGWCHYQREDYTGALQAFTTARSEYPNSAVADDAQLRIGDCQFQLQQWQQAQQAYAELADRSDSSLADEALYWLATAYQRAGDAEKALDAYKRLVSAHEDSSRLSDAYSYIGEIQIANSKIENAIEAYHHAEAAAKNKDQKRQARAGLAWANYRKTENIEKLKPIVDMITEKPAGEIAADFACRVAGAQSDGEQYENALTTLDSFLAGHPAHDSLPQALYMAGTCHEKLGDDRKAQQLYQKVIDGGSKSEYVSRAICSLVGLYARQGNLDRATEMADSLQQSEAEPAFVAFALYQLAETLYEQQAYERARQMYQRVMETAPDAETAPFAQLGLGWAQLRAGDAPSAAKTLRSLPAEYPEASVNSQLPDALIATAEKLFEAEDYKKAETLYALVPEQFPESKRVGEAEYRLGWVRLKQKKADEALQLFESAVKNANSETVIADARYQAARILLDRGDSQRARELLQPFQTTDIEFDRTAAALALLTRALIQLDYQEEAVSTAKTLTEQFPDEPHAAYGFLVLAKNQRRQKQYQKALDLLAKVTEAAKDDTGAEAQFLTAACHADLGDTERAAEEFLKVAIMYDTPRWAAQSQYRAGRCFEELDMTEDTTAAYKTIIKDYKDQSKWVEKAQKRLDGLNTEK